MLGNITVTSRWKWQVGGLNRFILLFIINDFNCWTALIQYLSKLSRSSLLGTNGVMFASKYTWPKTKHHMEIQVRKPNTHKDLFTWVTFNCLMCPRKLRQKQNKEELLLSKHFWCNSQELVLCGNWAADVQFNVTRDIAHSRWHRHCVSDGKIICECCVFWSFYIYFPDYIQCWQRTQDLNLKFSNLK